jgi:hypothetical protein
MDAKPMSGQMDRKPTSDKQDAPSDDADTLDVDVDDEYEINDAK